jgi:hypothetical protein
MVAVELIPEALEDAPRWVVAGAFVASALAMGAFQVLL